MEYIFIGTTVILVGYAALTLLFIRTRLTAGIGVGLTSMLMVVSSVYVLMTGNHQFSILFFLASIILPTFFAGLLISLPFLKSIVSMYMSLIRIGISQDRLDAAREDFANEMRQMIEQNGVKVDPGLAEDILEEAENFTEKEYQAVKKLAEGKNTLSDDEIFGVIGRQYTKAVVIREKLVEEGILKK